MSETHLLFEQLLGLPELSVTDVGVGAEQIDIAVESKLEAKHCPTCGHPSSKLNQSYTRRIRDLPISGRQVYLHLTTRQFHCADCQRYFYEQFEFVASHGQLTNRYERRVYHLCIGADFQYVAVKEDLCWKVVQRIFDTWSTRAFNAMTLWQEVRALGIDEIALKKGHKGYACVLVNLETGQIIDILPERTKAYLLAYFRQLAPTIRAGIEVYSSDLWDGYLSVGQSMFPNALLVIDRFHFFGHMQHAVDACRKHLRKRYPDDTRLKHIKWLLLKNRDTLSEEELAALRALFAVPEFAVLKQVYHAKNRLRQILEEESDPQQADQRLAAWEQQARAYHNPFIDTCLALLKRWKPHLLNYFHERFSTGTVEGLNNRLRALLRRAFGFLNFDHFRRRALIEAADLH
jgi:transposase